jgi:hypothetical protein
MSPLGKPSKLITAAAKSTKKNKQLGQGIPLVMIEGLFRSIAMAHCDNKTMGKKSAIYYSSMAQIYT